MSDLKGPQQAINTLAEQALNQARARFAPIETDAAPEPDPLKKKPGRKAAAITPSSTLQDLEKTLWATADKLRANMDAAEYKHIVLGLIFLKYISDSFSGRRAELERRFGDASDDYYVGSDDPKLLAQELEERDYYKEVNVFWVPEAARWES
ncbi:MAG: SAM-dependent DNA methyltransferase, partial [Oxalobacteraceae bacterium]